MMILNVTIDGGYCPYKVCRLVAAKVPDVARFDY
jgi:hypothetical protein